MVSKVEKFDHIVSFGYNCEVSFRIEEYTKEKLESFIFSWAYILEPYDCFLQSLNNIDDILQHEITILPNGMFKDEKYKIAFHGKNPLNELIDQNGIRNENNITIAIKELKERFSFLGTRLKNLLESDDKTLFIMKTRYTKDENTTREYIYDIYHFLEQNYISQKFMLLAVVSEEDCGMKIGQDSYEKLLIRQVKYFAPDDNTENGGDKKSWNQILEQIIM